MFAKLSGVLSFMDWIVCYGYKHTKKPRGILGKKR